MPKISPKESDVHYQNVFAKERDKHDSIIAADTPFPLNESFINRDAMRSRQWCIFCCEVVSSLTDHMRNTSCNGGKNKSSTDLKKAASLFFTGYENVLLASLINEPMNMDVLSSMASFEDPMDVLQHFINELTRRNVPLIGTFLRPPRQPSTEMIDVDCQTSPSNLSDYLAHPFCPDFDQDTSIGSPDGNTFSFLEIPQNGKFGKVTTTSERTMNEQELGFVSESQPTQDLFISQETNPVFDSQLVQDSEEDLLNT